MSVVDLRKVSIKTVEDAVDFLELFVAKAPAIASVLKNAKLKQISLENQVTHYKGKAAEPKGGNVSVLEQMTGKGIQASVPEQTEAEARLAQMRGGDAPAAPAATEDELPPAPVGPGEIGTLNLPNVGAKPSTDAPAPSLPGQHPVLDESGASSGIEMSEEDATAAAGSKSELPTDDGVQSEDTPAETPEGEETLSPEEQAALSPEPETGKPRPEDIESVGSKAARKNPAKKVK